MKSLVSISLLPLIGTVIVLTNNRLDSSVSSSSRSVCSAFQITSSISGPIRHIQNSRVDGRTTTSSTGWIPMTLSGSCTTTQLYMSTTNRQQQQQQQQRRRQQQQQPTNSKRRTLYGEYQRLFRGENDFYNILGINTSTSTIISMEDVKKAYKQKAKEYHPDVNRSNGYDTTKEFQLVNRAYQVLSDPQRKERYDNAMQYYKNEQIRSHLKGLDEYEKTFYNTNPTAAATSGISIQSNESNESKYNMENVMDISSPLWQAKVTKTKSSTSTPYTSTPYTSMYIDTKYYKFSGQSSTAEITSSSFTSAICDQDATGTGLPFTPNYNSIHYHKNRQQQQNQQQNQNHGWHENFQQPLSGVGSTSNQEKATDIEQIVDDFFGWSSSGQQQGDDDNNDSTTPSMYHLINDSLHQETITSTSSTTTSSSAIVQLNSNTGSKNDNNDATETNASVQTSLLPPYPMIPTSISSFVPQEETTTTTSSTMTNSNNDNSNKYNTNNGSIIPMKTTEIEKENIITGDDLIFDYEIDYRTSIFGTEDIVYIKHYETCYNCLGSGIKPGTEVKHKCRTCGGTGMKLNINKQQVQTTAIGTFVTEDIHNTAYETCSNCFGLGYTIKGEHCDTCCETSDDHEHHHDTASGLIEVVKRTKVIIPPKRKNGDIICIKGEGNAGSYGIAPGDLYIKLIIDTENNDSNIWYTSTGTSFDYMSINEYQRISVQTPTIRPKFIQRIISNLEQQQQQQQQQNQQQ